MFSSLVMVVGNLAGKYAEILLKDCAALRELQNVWTISNHVMVVSKNADISLHIADLWLFTGVARVEESMHNFWSCDVGGKEGRVVFITRHGESWQRYQYKHAGVWMTHMHARGYRGMRLETENPSILGKSHMAFERRFTCFSGMWSVIYKDQHLSHQDSAWICETTRGMHPERVRLYSVSDKLNDLRSITHLCHENSTRICTKISRRIDIRLVHFESRCWCTFLELFRGLWSCQTSESW